MPKSRGKKRISQAAPTLLQAGESNPPVDLMQPRSKGRRTTKPTAKGLAQAVSDAQPEHSIATQANTVQPDSLPQPQEEIHILSPRFGECTPSQSSQSYESNARPNGSLNQIIIAPGPAQFISSPDLQFGPADELGAHVPNTLRQKIRARE